MIHKPFYPLKQEIAPLLEGRMMALVRPVKDQPDNRGLRYEMRGGKPGWEDWHGRPYDCPFGNPETQLMCKESFVLRHKYDRYYYHADHLEPYTDPYAHDGWKSPVLMPKSACRLWLEVVDVKVCKLMNLSNEEIYETGVRIEDSYKRGISTGCEGSVEGFNLGQGIRRVFYEIFEENFGKRGVTNPWIWYAAIRRIDKPENNLNNTITP